jgi:hypothetical protein
MLRFPRLPFHMPCDFGIRSAPPIGGSSVFRRTKHYALTAPMECVVSNGWSLSGRLVNLSLHGAFVADAPNIFHEFEPGDLVDMQLGRPHRGTEVVSVELKARVIWRNIGVVETLPNGLGFEFVHDEHTLRQCVAMMSELCRLDVVEHQRVSPWFAPDTSSPS